MIDIKTWKVLVILGLIFILVGLLLLLFEKYIPLIKLSGDIHIKEDGFELYFPVPTMIIISLVITIILNLIFHK